MNICIKSQFKQLEIGKLVYGAVVTGVPSNPDCIYIKVDKRRPGAGIDRIGVGAGKSILLNVKTGGLRAVSGSMLVTVLDATLHLVIEDSPEKYLKPSYCTDQD